MKNIHQFEVTMQWDKPATNTDKKQFKNHSVAIHNKPNLNISAAKSFKGDATLYNPEDLLLSSLVSCHFMSYLYCCSQHDIEVVSYTDAAQAFLEVNANGSGRITKVILQPKVIIKNASQVELANTLHTQANKLCFIANSCNFIVAHEAECTSL